MKAKRLFAPLELTLETTKEVETFKKLLIDSESVGLMLGGDVEDLLNDLSNMWCIDLQKSEITPKAADNRPQTLNINDILMSIEEDVRQKVEDFIEKNYKLADSNGDLIREIFNNADFFMNIESACKRVGHAENNLDSFLDLQNKLRK